jgi:hypothetical protein
MCVGLVGGAILSFDFVLQNVTWLTTYNCTVDACANDMIPKKKDNQELQYPKGFAYSSWLRGSYVPLLPTGVI